MSDDYDRLLGEIANTLAGHDREPELAIPYAIDVAGVRRKTGLSQEGFAARIGVPVATLRNWEQGRRVPKGPGRVLLALLERNPRIVEETLSV